MALLPCYECGTAISTAATSCPNCGAPNKMKVDAVIPKEKPKTRPIFKVLALMLVGFFAFALFSNHDAPTPKAQPQQDAISVEAEKLAADYRNNEVSADIAYKDKQFIVAGVVESINKDFKGDIWVALKTDNQFMPIHAEGLTAAQASQLQKGSVVAVICDGAGMVVGSPFLKNCRLPNRGAS